MLTIFISVFALLPQVSLPSLILRFFILFGLGFLNLGVSFGVYGICLVWFLFSFSGMEALSPC